MTLNVEPKMRHLSDFYNSKEQMECEVECYINLARDILRQRPTVFYVNKPFERKIFTFKKPVN